MDPTFALLPAGLIKLALALLIGALIGVEREFRDKAAGFRTMILICVGATLFTIFSIQIAGADNDRGRIAAQIVTGVGFLGAGVILHHGGEVKGLTTASTIWLAAALGVGLGGGFLAFSTVAAGVVLFVLWVLPLLEERIEQARDMRTYRIIAPASPEEFAKMEGLFRQAGLRVIKRSQTRRGQDMICTWMAHGAHPAHDQIIEQLFADPQVKEFEYGA